MEQLSPAGLALLDLAAAAGLSLVSRSHVMVDRERVTIGEAEQRLAALPKPVACTAIVVEGELLIACRAPDVTELFIMRERSEVIRREEGIAGDLVRLMPNRVVLVRAAGVESSATREAILEWIIGYCSTSPSAVELSSSADGSQPALTMSAS